MSEDTRTKTYRNIEEINCAICGRRLCYSEGKDCIDKADDFFEEMKKPFNTSVMKAAAEIEAEGYGLLTRLEELIVFCEKMNWNRIGMAFCIGLSAEAAKINKILRQKFKVNSACCKLCGIQKDDIGMNRLYPEREVDTSCNPIGQAEALNAAGTDLNVMVGLCMGHDILFQKYSKAPVTTFIVKDRVLGHNPVMALWSGYHQKRFAFDASGSKKT